MNQADSKICERAFAPPEARENQPITQDAKKGSEMLGEIKNSMKIATNAAFDSNESGNFETNVDAYANIKFEKGYQSAKEKAREEMKEQMCNVGQQ